MIAKMPLQDLALPSRTKRSGSPSSRPDRPTPPAASWDRTHPACSFGFFLGV